MTLFFYDPDLLSSYDVPTFLLKLLLPRVQESLAAKLECREIHEKMSIPGNVFDRQQAQRDSDEFHHDSRNFGDIIGDSVRIVGAKNYCNQYLYLAFQ